MGIYILAITVAALLQLSTVYFLRDNFLRHFIFAIPAILIFQFLFLWSYSTAPKFIIIWFITAALTSTLALIISYFVFKEQITVWNALGILLIFSGLYFLHIK